MVYRVIQELKLINQTATSEEDAVNKLVRDNNTQAQFISVLDNSGDEDWTNNRSSFMNTVNNIVYSWNNDTQVLTRTYDFESEQLYDIWQFLIPTYFSPSTENPRTATTIFEGNV